MKNILFVLILLGLAQSAFSQTKDRDYYLYMSKALGYAYAIEFSNDLIQERFGSLSKRAMLAQLDFNLAHGNSVDFKEGVVSNEFNLSKVELKKDIMDEIIGQFDIDQFSQSEADKYLRNFK